MEIAPYGLRGPMNHFSKLLIASKATIREAMRCIDENSEGIAIVVGKDNCLIGTITDGDIRRAILAGINLDLSVKKILERRTAPHPTPLTAPTGTSREKILAMMNRYAIRHIPIVDSKGRLTDVSMLSELIHEPAVPVTALVMAGGYGKRLRPFTHKTPKPMLSVGSEPILKLILNQLRRNGIRQVNISTHYKSGQIARHFGDGKNLGVNIQYLKEEEPLGTAGSLRLIKKQAQPILVINGDILTRVNFKAMIEFHRQNKADMTIAVQKYDVKIAYGVVEVDNVRVKKITEKPVQSYFVNAGIYLIEPRVLKMAPKRKKFDMPELIEKLLAKNYKIVSFPVREYWLDIGTPEDYKKAQIDVRRSKRQGGKA